MHVIEQFNGGLYDTIIASDERLVNQNEDETNGNEAQDADSTNKKSKNNQSKR